MKFRDIVYILLRLRKLILRKDFLYIPLGFNAVKKFGNDGAEWYLLPNLNSDSIVYSFGVGNDISFDLEMIKRFGTKDYAFDPTPKSIEWLKKQRLPGNFVFSPLGLAGYDGELKFFLPDNPNNVSASVVSNNLQGEYFTAQVKCLKTLMEQNKHTKIDVLKMDIEGAEYDVIDNILASNIEINQILIEFHHRFKGIGNIKTKEAINKLAKHGYKVIHVNQKTGEEYTFVKQ